MGPRPAQSVQPTWDVVLATTQTLGEHREAWENLAQQALEENVFYESWMLEPALHFLAGTEEIKLLLIYRKGSLAERQLCGFFPLVIHRPFRKLPIQSLSLWQHRHCYLTLPLLHRDHASECLERFFDWVGQIQHWIPLLEFPEFPADGPIAKLVSEIIAKLSLKTYRLKEFSRAILRKATDVEEYLASVVSSEKRRDLGRKVRRLEDLGEVSFQSPESLQKMQTMVSQFLQIEEKGWKGKANTALLCNTADTDFFRAITDSAWQRDQLLLKGLYLDDTPLALRCSFMSQETAFFFKPTYDEDYRAYSPGVLLEMATIRDVFASEKLQAMDSCTSPDNELINQIYRNRRKLCHLLCSTSHVGSGIILNWLPKLRSWAKYWSRKRS